MRSLISDSKSKITDKNGGFYSKTKRVSSEVRYYTKENRYKWFKNDNMSDINFDDNGTGGLNY